MALPLSSLTLNQRLARHVGRRVTIEAVGFSSEAGLLQSVTSRFARVSSQNFVPATLNQIVLLDIENPLPSTQVSIRTTYRGTGTARVRRVGRDFVETIEIHSGQRRRIIMPLNKVISIEEIS